MDQLPDVANPAEKHLVNEDFLRLDVIVHRGRNIVQSYWRTFTSLGLDRTVDPYVSVSVTRPAKPFEDFAEELTTSKTDEANPEWNEHFSFIVDAGKGDRGRGDVIVVVWDDNYGPDTKYSNDITIELKELRLDADFSKRTLQLGGGAEIDMSLKIGKMSLDMRIGRCLHPSESVTVEKRKEKCAAAISKLLGRTISPDKAPVVSIVGSGGGFRAMTSMSGVAQGLQETGVMDLCTYFATLSGSTWYLSHLYTTDGGPDVYRCADYLKKHVSEMGKIMQIQNASQFVPTIYERYLEGLYVSLVDLWECYLSAVFEPLKEKTGSKKVSDQRPHVESANLPFPIYTALHVAEEVETEAFAEWIEFTPYEYGVYNYGSFMAIEHLAASKCHGVVCRKFRELDQTFFIAVWGSAFAASIEVIAENTLGKAEGALFRSLLAGFLDATGLDDMRPFAASVPNLFYGLKRRSLWRISRSVHTALAGFKSSVCRLSKSLLGGEAEAAEKNASTVSGVKKGRKRRAGPAIKKKTDKQMKAEDAMMIVDGGLAFNDPFPPLLRAERRTDVYIVFDFSWHTDQTEYPFGEMEKAVKWAKANNYKLPEVDPKQFDKDNVKEYYVFEDEKDPECPIVIFFPLSNASGQRATIDGTEQVINPFSPAYGTTHFAMTSDEFESLKELNRYNARQGFDAIKTAIEKKVK